MTGDQWLGEGTRSEETKNGCGLRTIKKIVIGYQ